MSHSGGVGSPAETIGIPAGAALLPYILAVCLNFFGTERLNSLYYFTLLAVTTRRVKGLNSCR